MGLLDQELTRRTAGRRKRTAELLFGGKMPQPNQNALEIWTLAAKFVIKTEVLHKLFTVISAGTACSKNPTTSLKGDFLHPIFALNKKVYDSKGNMQKPLQSTHRGFNSRGHFSQPIRTK